MAFHSQGPNSQESWGKFTCRYCPAWSDCDVGQRGKPQLWFWFGDSLLPLWPFTCAARGEAAWWWLTIYCSAFFLWKKGKKQIAFLQEPHAQWVTAFPWTQKGKLMVCSGEWLFLGKTSWTWTCCRFFLGYKGRETSKDQGKKTQTSKISKARLPWAATGAGSVLCVVPNTAVKQSMRDFKCTKVISYSYSCLVSLEEISG